ncbi:transglycosylase [Saccharopolyspora subtropica]|uniref:Resuscitation-promoting factor n=1 Tax=Saccharopolyspora thermophila TaxID=89367 RepID=A0A917N6T9_9PSEU|nr:resuscitation-promoting factor [Saccharopolyspora subtropica]GGI69618.1 transglycosylase [Saccharopolyspora subtropica]
MNGRGEPGHHGQFDRHDDGYWADSFDTRTDWFTPVQAADQHTAVGLLERPETERYPAQDHPSFPPGALEITPEDIYEVLGPDAEDMLATAEIDVDEVIRLINAETTVLPPLVIPDTLPEVEEGQAPPPEVVEAISTWKRRFLKGAVAGVLLTLTGTGGAAAAMDKSVTVEIDGQERTINTYEDTVGEVLADEGITVGEHDALSPSPQAEVGHGDTITLDRGRLLKLNVDGEMREEWVRSVTVDQALRQLGVAADRAWVSADRSMAVPVEGMELTVKTLKNITVIDGANAPRQLTTHAVTIDELVHDEQFKLGPEDTVTPGGDQRLVDGAEVRITRNGSTVINVTMPVEPPVQEIVDNTMFKGEERVDFPGVPGEKIVTARVITRNGEEVRRETVGEKVLKQAQPRVVRVGGKPRPTDGVWDKLAQCEATGNWHANTGNGYYGGLQFNKSTWDAYGGDQYAPYPHQASREQQIAVAEKVRAARGGSYGAWPHCSAKLGLD